MGAFETYQMLERGFLQGLDFQSLEMASNGLTMLVVLSISLLCTLVLFISHVARLILNYRLARKTGLPIYITPFNPTNVVWVTFSGISRPLFAKILPRFLYERFVVTCFGWEFYERNRINKKLGRVFMLVTPGKNEMWVADAAIAEQVMSRRKDFPAIEKTSSGFPKFFLLVQLSLATEISRLGRSPVLHYNSLAPDPSMCLEEMKHMKVHELTCALHLAIMGRFGPSILACEHEEWPRHRKSVAPILNERRMSCVWEECSIQAGDMINHLTSDTLTQGPVALQTTTAGIKTITLNAISYVAYGAQNAWKQPAERDRPPPGHKLTFIETLTTIALNFIVAIFIPRRILMSACMPKMLRDVGAAVSEFPSHAKALIAKERANQSQSGNRSLLSDLVKSPNNRVVLRSESKTTTSGLSDDEIVGNLFNFLIAGFQTINASLDFAIVLLAIEPKWQDWIIEEIDAVEQTCHANKTYAERFPRLKRCRALMYEILRLYPPLNRIARCAAETQTIPNIIPADTSIMISPLLIHMSAEAYPEPLEFNPKRWIRNEHDSATPLSEHLIEPSKRTFVPWANGPKTCPGSKLSQVEFVAVIAEVYRHWRVNAAVPTGTTSNKAKAKLQKVIDTSYHLMALHLGPHKGVDLEWTRRSHVPEERKQLAAKTSATVRIIGPVPGFPMSHYC